MEIIVILGLLSGAVYANIKSGISRHASKWFYAPVEQVMEMELLQQWMKRDWELKRTLHMLYPEQKKEKVLWEFRRRQGVTAYTLMSAACILTLSVRIMDAVSKTPKADARHGKLFILGIIVSILGAYIPQARLNNLQKKREEELLVDYPEIINKFILLLGAGLTMKGALARMLRERREDEMRYAYKELKYIYHEMNNGITEAAAFEQLGNRIRMIPYMRFGALVSQNLKKGSAGLIPLLELEATEAFSQRKENAKRRGEEASTKMLLPMMMMLGIVMAIIVIPAFMVL